MADTEKNTNVNNNGENGAAGAPETKDKVKFKDRVKAALTKKREYSVLGIVKTVGMIAAIPVAIAIGKGIQRNEDEQLMATLTDNNYNPEPQAALPGNTETEVQQEIIEPDYEEVE